MSLLLTRVSVYKPISKQALMNRSFWLAVLMLLASTVCHSLCVVVGGNNVRLAVLAVTLAEGWLWAYPLTAARLSASIATMN